MLVNAVMVSWCHGGLRQSETVRKMVWPMWESKRVIAWRLGSSSVTINSISGRSGPLGEGKD